MIRRAWARLCPWMRSLAGCRGGAETPTCGHWHAACECRPALCFRAAPAGVKPASRAGQAAVSQIGSAPRVPLTGRKPPPDQWLRAPKQFKAIHAAQLRGRVRACITRAAENAQGPVDPRVVCRRPVERVALRRLAVAMDEKVKSPTSVMETSEAYPGVDRSHRAPRERVHVNITGIVTLHAAFPVAATPAHSQRSHV